MNPASRIQATIEILEKAAASSRIPLDGTVGDYMRSRRYIGSKDRADIVERVYKIVRAKARLGWWLEKLKAADTPRNRVLAFAALAENKAPGEVAALFSGEKFAPAELTAEERGFLFALPAGEGLDHKDMGEAVRVECPPQYEAALRAYFGGAFAAEMRAMMESAPLDLRVNVWRNTRGEAQKSLAQDGVKTAPAPFSPWGLRAQGKAFLSNTKAFVKGLVEIQDEGSQLIAHMCAAQSGQHILDYCAGAGGKTMALAAAMKNKGRIVAMDIEANRLEKARPRFRRAGVHDIIETRPLSDEKSRKWLRRQKETFDAVLVDVPCSGTGTWRRNPDMRWRNYGPSLEDLLVTQAEILEKVAKAVKPGGRLVYATCSLLPAENEDQVAKFLAAHPEFQPFEVQKELRDGDSPHMRLTPYRHNTDGFFAAVLVRAIST
jgi:16S rRNA (cytosine967-C5)-methyltransferase